MGKTEGASFGYEALDSLSTRFKVPLEVDCSLLQKEWDDMVDYARQYLNPVQEEYQVVWWKLFNAVDAKKWSNVLAFVELLFWLPMANGCVERIFSQLKLIKTGETYISWDRQARLFVTDCYRCTSTLKVGC